MKKELVIALVVLLVPLALFFYLPASTVPEGKTMVRIGYFPNILHAQALVGTARGDFQRELGPDVVLKTITFNAGPSAVEAMFADEVDIVYIGPNPAINGYSKSNGTALKIITGAASGGAVFVVKNDSGIKAVSDLTGKKLASPQLGNTQDVALRAYLKDNGFEVGQGAAKVQVIPTENPQILTLFQKGEIDGAWVPEPWAARLVKEGGGTRFIDERTLWKDGKFVTAHVIVSTKFLKGQPKLVKKFLRAHVEVTEWINRNPEEAKKIMNEQIKNITTKALPAQVLDDAFTGCEITYDPVSSSLLKSADDAFVLGFLGKQKPDLSGIYDLGMLNEVLEEKNLARVE